MICNQYLLNLVDLLSLIKSKIFFELWFVSGEDDSTLWKSVDDLLVDNLDLLPVETAVVHSLWVGNVSELVVHENIDMWGLVASDEHSLFLDWLSLGELSEVSWHQVLA